MKQNYFNTRTITLIAMLSALSALLMVINMPLPFAPTFLKFEIAEFPGLFAGYFMGPTAAVIVISLKNVIKLVIQGTDTAYVGEFLNICGSIIYTLPAAFIYKYRNDIKGARISLIVATVVCSLAWIPLNMYIGFPMYATVYGLQMDAIVGMGAAANPLINNMLTLMVFGILPFNIVKLSATSVVTWLLYKHVGNYLRRLVRLPDAAKAATPAA
jgi:riboflavin transporter FmnP